MTNWLQPTAEEIEQHRQRSGRMKVAIEAARLRTGIPLLEAVLGNEGILIAEFYGLRGGSINSRMGRIFAQFDYDEYDLAIEHVQAM